MPIEKHDFTIPVSGNPKLKRYMTFEKFEKLIQNSSLFFCRADKFDDFNEGRFLKRVKKGIRDSNFNSVSNHIKASKNISNIHQWLEKQRKYTVVNCWKMYDSEDTYMWNNYSNQDGGICISTDYLSLVNSIQHSEKIIHSSIVRYINFKTEHWYHPTNYPFTDLNLLIPFFHKDKKKFKDENEFRLIYPIREALNSNHDYWKNKNEKNGTLIKVNLEALLQMIIFHPEMTREKKNEIRDFLDENNLKNIQTQNSEFTK